MRRLLTPLMFLGLLTLVARGDDKPTPAATELEALKKSIKEDLAKRNAELRTKRDMLEKQLEEAKTDEEKKEIQKKISAVPSNDPPPEYSLKYLTFAQQHVKDKAALESLKLGMDMSGGPFVKDGPWGKIVDEVRTNHAADANIRSVMRLIARGAFDESSEKLLLEVAKKNPDKKNQAVAYKTLAATMEIAANVGDSMQQNKAQRASAEARFGKEFVAKVIADADKNRKTAEEARKTLKDCYGDIFPDLSIGKPAPEVVSKDITGKEVRLSALKGKVVVLDIWATWCPPCRAMIPHEREMVEKTFKDKPFVLVSISADAELKTLTNFLAETKMPWTHWWNGQSGGIVEDWEVGHFPTIYVLDAKGIIRFKELRGEKLEEAVEGLLKEAAAK